MAKDDDAKDEHLRLVTFTSKFLEQASVGATSACPTRTASTS
jgi:hypothetical protein